MHRRLTAILAILSFAFGGGGCAKDKNYDEILMPAQTGSVLQRRVQVPKGPEVKPKEKKKKEKEKEKPSSSQPKTDEEPSPEATPKPEPESTPPTERFR